MTTRFGSRAGRIAVLATAVFYGVNQANAQGRTWYVDLDKVNGSQTGKTWNNAFLHLQDALDVAVATDEIWVAEGLYKPTKDPAGGSDSQDFTFDLTSGVDVYGGFKGLNSETSVELRSGKVNRTILNGDQADQPPHLNGLDSYHIVTIDGDTDVTLDGFRIERGNADGFADAQRGQGGGIRIEGSSNVRLSNLIVRGCHARRGGGIYSTGSTVYARHLTLTGNLAKFTGGGMDLTVNHASHFHSILFDTNAASPPNVGEDPNGLIGNGGAVHVASSVGTQEFANVLAYDNSGRRGGFAYLGDNGNAALDSQWINCTVAFNKSAFFGLPPGEGEGEGFYVKTVTGGSAAHEVLNSIVWGNEAGINTTNYDIELAPGASQVTVLHSDVGTDNGAFPFDPDNLSEDPLFVDEMTRNLRLVGSPSPTISGCIDTGDQAFLPVDVTDVDDNDNFVEVLPWSYADGEARVVIYPWAPGADVDMGCYEKDGAAGVE